MSTALSILAIATLLIAAAMLLVAYGHYCAVLRPFLRSNAIHTSRVDIFLFPITAIYDLRRLSRLRDLGAHIPAKVTLQKRLLWTGLALFIVALSFGFLSGVLLEMK